MALNPHQKNKIDINSLSPEEQRLFRLYGKLPSRSDHFAKHLKERKYFDSGDYAMSKAGKGDGVDTGTGSQHPVPEKIPHLSSPPPAAAPSNGNGNGSHGSAAGVTGSGTPAGGVSGLTLGIPGAVGASGGLHLAYQQAGSPVKESSFLHNETSVEDIENNNTEEAKTSPVGPGQIESIPIRR